MTASKSVEKRFSDLMKVDRMKTHIYSWLEIFDNVYSKQNLDNTKHVKIKLMIKG